MFSNVGWGEILLILIVGLVLIGPERLPHIITDIRAMILAARTAIDDARQSITGEFGEDFDELRKPLGELSDLRRMSPRTAITRTLFDGDDTYLDLLSGKPAAGGGTGDAAAKRGGTGKNAALGSGPTGANATGANAASANDASAGGATAAGASGATAASAGGATAGGWTTDSGAADSIGAAADSAAADDAQAPAAGHNWADDDVL
ncbi:Sec-independent protein translocase protein TatB [uncultured Corynebacterium sp.]|uniref:Sec-independent protein translocase protein TatB n=1 Tax=uncultured Corynebacterium sp. TaxID=159447 RepID=UPI00345DEBE1